MNNYPPLYPTAQQNPPGFIQQPPPGYTQQPQPVFIQQPQPVQCKAMIFAFCSQNSNKKI
jgi:hypothetical protein